MSVLQKLYKSSNHCKKPLHLLKLKSITEKRLL